MRRFNDYELHRLGQQRHRELIAEAEQERLARRSDPAWARRSQRRRGWALPHLAGAWGFHRRWLARLGGVLMVWGYRLQGQDAPPPAPALAGKG